MGSEMCIRDRFWNRHAKRIKSPRDSNVNFWGWAILSQSSVLHEVEYVESGNSRAVTRATPLLGLGGYKVAHLNKHIDAKHSLPSQHKILVSSVMRRL